MNSASTSATTVEDIQVTHSISTQTNTPLAAIYKENIKSANKAALIESAILSRQHALEIECILVERNAYPTTTVLNTIRTTQLITDPAIKQSILHYQKRIRGLCYLLLPSDIKKDICEAIFIILEPPSPHCLDEYIRITTSPLSEVPKPIPPPAASRIAPNDPATISLPDLELGTQAAPIIISDSMPPSPNARVTRREQKRWLHINSKSIYSTKTSMKALLTFSLPDKYSTYTEFNNFICRNCKEQEHCHKNCPLYWCCVCHEQQPGHLSVYCKKLKGKDVCKKIHAPPTTAFESPDFYTHMKIWEAHINEDIAQAYEQERDNVLNEFEWNYDFNDDLVYYANQDD
ncbi:hypothetical protein EDD22DRAFT_960783 [Suillus occidentalis]|nr:hypothetical protein EDD22DRAFT_960783 [Suillus occidentalis]